MMQGIRKIPSLRGFGRCRENGCAFAQHDIA